MSNSVLKIILLGSMLMVMPQSVLSEPAETGDQPPVTVYKSPYCGCCSKWIDHLEENGFEVSAIHRHDMGEIKQQSGVPARLASCHTAIIDGYVIEGHVPAADIKRLLKYRPVVAGLSVPGMPMGSPGMEGHRQDRYDVLTFTQTGETSLYNRY